MCAGQQCCQPSGSTQAGREGGLILSSNNNNNNSKDDDESQCALSTVGHYSEGSRDSVLRSERKRICIIYTKYCPSEERRLPRLGVGASSLAAVALTSQDQVVVLAKCIISVETDILLCLNYCRRHYS